MMFDFAVRVDFWKSEYTDLSFKSSSIKDVIFEDDLDKIYPKITMISSEIQFSVVSLFQPNIKTTKISSGHGIPFDTL